KAAENKFYLEMNNKKHQLLNQKKRSKERRKLIGKKVVRLNIRKWEVNTFGDKEDGVSSELKEESINEIKNELPKRKHTTVGLSKVNIETKNQIAIENEALNNHHDTYTFNEDISTITLNNSETNLDNSNKLSIIMEDCNDQDSMLTPSSSNNISESAFTSSIQPKSRNPLVPLTAIENMNIPHSVEQLRTKRIRNNKRKGALEYSNLQNKYTEIVSSLPPLRRRKIDNPALEELFDKQGIGWNRKEFAKECQVQNIRLDDDDIINATKLVSWFDRKKNKTKSCNTATKI
ncbi:16807_t:CDS:2, partial [Dentiscutata heterogama]